MAKYNKFMMFWVGDYLRDTTHLTAQRHGVYTLLIFHYWSNECLPTDIDEIYMITKAFNKEVQQDTDFILKSFFKEFKHARIDEALAQASEKYNKRVDAQKKSVEKRISNANCNANDKASRIALACASDSDSDSNISKKNREKRRFNEFWDSYPKGHKNSKKRALVKWKASNLDKIADIIFTHIKKSIAEDDRWKSGFVPDACTYLNQERWDGDIYKEHNADTPNQQQAALEDNPIMVDIKELLEKQQMGNKLAMADGTAIRLISDGKRFEREDNEPFGDNIFSLQTYQYMKENTIMVTGG